MTHEEILKKYEDIRPLINFYWNSIRNRLILMETPYLTIPYLGMFQVNKKKLYAIICKNIICAKNHKEKGKMGIYNRKMLEIKKLRKLLHKQNVIDYYKSL